MRIITRMAAVLATAAAFVLATPIVPASVTQAGAQERVRISEEFRLALEPYGEFRPHPRWGEVWVPTDVSPDWRPYTVGHWVNSEDYGWYWASDQSEADWGWITFHYGHWVFDRDLGWVWVPGRIWGPAFVNWRRGDRYIGWAPEPPDELVAEVRDVPDYWVFVPARDFLAPRLVTVIVPAREREVLIERTVVENRTVVFRDRGFAVNPGIPAAFVAASIGRPIHTFQVRPVVVAGTANLAGATVVRASELRQRRDVIARQSIQQTGTVVQPARNVPPPQPLAANANGRLGDNPPRAARGATTGAGPSQAAPPAAQTTPPVRGPQRYQGTAPSPQTPPTAAQRRAQPPTTSGQAPTQQLDRGAEQRRPGTQERNNRATQTPPSMQAPNGRGTTGAAPPSARELRPQGREQAQPPRRPAQAPAARAPTPPQAPAARAPTPPPQAPAARIPTPPPQAPAARAVAPRAPAAQAPRPQAPAAQAPRPQAPAAQAPRPQPPAAQAPRPQAPAAQAPRAQPPATTGAGPRGPRPQEGRR